VTVFRYGFAPGQQSLHACSVELKCSGHGVSCAAVDRDCIEHARSDGLEVVCERGADEGARVFVYCPPGAAARDSGVMWILLCVAIGIAVVGGFVTFLAWTRRANHRNGREPKARSRTPAE
jgi:hypothetical protein